jgi:hypothetical protein
MPSHTQNVLRRRIEAAAALDAEHQDLRLALGREDLNPETLHQPFPFIWAAAYTRKTGEYCGAEQSIFWSPTLLSFGAFAAVCHARVETAKKTDYAVAFMTLKGIGPPKERQKRGKNNARSWTGIQLDDDNHNKLGRDAITKAGGPLRITYSTASDGKEADSFPLSAYSGPNLPPIFQATDADVQTFLNSKKDGEPYRDVRVDRFPSGIPHITQGEENSFVHFTMQPQTRSRTIIPFKKPIEGELLEEILSRNLDKKICEAIEFEIFGVIAHDEKTKTVNAAAFLPTGNRREFFFQLCGDDYYLDAIAIAQRVLAENPPRAKSSSPPRTEGGLVGGLRGLLLATFIEEQADELQLGSKTCPLVLKRCPFADEHGSRRGQADGSAYVFDADPEMNGGYAVVKCQHNSCRNRTTQEFVNEMIAASDLPSDIYNNTEYRLPAGV